MKPSAEMVRRFNGIFDGNSSRGKQEEQPPVITLLGDGARFKVTFDRYPLYFWIMDMEKETLTVGLPSDGRTTLAEKDDKIAIVGTFDEVLDYIGKFMQMTRDYIDYLREHDEELWERRVCPRWSYSIEEDLGTEDMAGCKTRGLDLAITSSEIGKAPVAEKPEAKTGITARAKVYVCPEVDLSELQDGIAALQKKLVAWFKKWEEVFGTRFTPYENGGPGPPCKITGEEVLEFQKLWKGLSGFPFHIWFFRQKGPREEAFVVFDVVSYQWTEVAPTEFKVPEDYKVLTVEQISKETFPEEPNKW